jgi:hypothetical protein
MSSGSIRVLMLRIDAPLGAWRFRAGVTCDAAFAAFDEAALVAAVVSSAAARGVTVQASDVHVSVTCRVVLVSGSARLLQSISEQAVQLVISVVIDVRRAHVPTSRCPGRVPRVLGPC